jgi:hypothetical protein
MAAPAAACGAPSGSGIPRAGGTPACAARRASPEGKEGLAAFLAKRKPNWMG